MANTVGDVSILSYRPPPSAALMDKLKAMVEKYGPTVGPYATIEQIREAFGHAIHVQEHLFGLTGICIYAECYVMTHGLEGGELNLRDARDWYKSLSAAQQRRVGLANIPHDFTVLQTYLEGDEGEGDVFGPYSEADFQAGMNRELERMALLELARGDTTLTPRLWLDYFARGLVQPSMTLKLDITHLLNIRIKFQQMLTAMGAK